MRAANDVEIAIAATARDANIFFITIILSISVFFVFCFLFSAYASSGIFVSVLLLFTVLFLYAIHHLFSY